MASKLFPNGKLYDYEKLKSKSKSKEPPKYIFVKHPRNNTKKKKLNPRWTAWSKRQKDKEIDKQVETYVKKNQMGQKINKDLTKDYKNNKESGIGPIREGNKYANKLKANKKNVSSSKVDKTKTDNSTKTENKTNGTTNGSSESKKGKETLKVKPKRFISDPRNKGRKYSVRTAKGKKLANKLKARERAKAMFKKNKEKKKV